MQKFTKFLKGLIFNDNVYCSIFVAILMWVITIIPINKELTDPFAEALADFEITDLGFTVLRANKSIVEADENIIIVNTGKLGNAEIAAIIDTLNQYNPGVIGINEVFHQSEDYLGDSLLVNALKNTKELVFAAKLKDYNDSTKQWQAIEHSDSIFINFPHEENSVRYAEVGLENMFTHERDFKTTRHFYSKANYNGSEMKFFASELVEIVAPEKVEKFMQRANDYEVINYTGNTGAFTTLDSYQVLNREFDPALIKGKIVILGYLGESLLEEKFWDDYKYYTPLNKKYAGKTFPDMFETVIYANIASQIIKDNHIYVVSDTVNLIINIILCLINVILFSKLFHAAAVWWDVFSIVATLVEIIVLLLSTAFIFSYFGVEINLNGAIVFTLVLGQFIELYYGLFKVALQKVSVKFMIADEAAKRDKLERSMKNTTKNVMNDLRNINLQTPNLDTDLNSNK